jgi:seryl-tRNA synthetase
MLDITLIREQPDFVRDELAKKGYAVDFSVFLERDAKRRQLIYETERLKAEKNQTSAQIPQLKKSGQDVAPLLARMKEINETIKSGDEQISHLNTVQKAFLDALPNLPADDVLPGGKENNQVVRSVGKRPEFSFQPQHHVDLCERLGLIDYKSGARLGGSGFWVYRKLGAQLEWALLNYFIEEHLKDGYEMILPPHILTWQCGYTAGQFPKFADDVFQLRQDDGESFSQFILPTAETALVNLHRDEILSADQLPLKYFAFTPCYRKEAGSYRAEERGMIRGHQFNKIEMFQYVLPGQADHALQELVDKASRLVENLGLHFQVSKLAAGDCSASMRRTYDIEVWIPSMNDYKEVSSASDAGDYQARRGNIRYRDPASQKPGFVHTLNASGLATSRIFPAIIEQFQMADGRIAIPDVLQKWMGGIKWLEA